MPRVIWKGAITFGLVHVPVALYPASKDVGIDFDWLDKRSMDPVGYKRVNKRTGKDIQSENIVKGIAQDDGDYVILSEDQIKAAYPKSTQTISGRLPLAKRCRHRHSQMACTVPPAALQTRAPTCPCASAPTARPWCRPGQRHHEKSWCGRHHPYR